MPCTVKCRCGKAEMRFNKLQPGQIENFDCGDCDANELPAPKSEKPEEPKASKKKPAKSKASSEAPPAAEQK